MKLTKAELNELQARRKLVNEALARVNALDLYAKVYLNSVLAAKGLDVQKKNWDVSLKTGKIVEKEIEVPVETQPKE